MIDLRAQRHVPSSATVVEQTFPIAKYNVTVYTWNEERNGKEMILAKAFVGKRKKPVWFFRFDSVENRQARIDDLIADKAKCSAYDEERKAKVASFERDVVVGDIIASSWGWEQTNVSFYQVTELVGKKSIKFREVSQERTYDSSMSGQCTPVPNDFVGGEYKKQYGIYGSKLNSSETASKWNGRPKYWSSYA